MQKPALVVMAAGMGSRYGGLKQIDPVGRRTRRQLLGREGAVGRGGVAVQVGVEGEGHRAILRSA